MRFYIKVTQASKGRRDESRFNVHRKALRLLKGHGARWLNNEWLPAYAPDLNLVVAMWSCIM